MTETNPTRKRLVSDWGLPTEADLPVIVEHDSGYLESFCYADVPRNIRSWWPLVVPTEIEPPPAPEGWRPMNELPDNHTTWVYVANEDGTVDVVLGSARAGDAPNGRQWWRHLVKPAHPGVGR